MSLPFSPIKNQGLAQAVVDTVARHLQTSYGLRTLSPRNPAYAQRYGGSSSARTRAYQQGTAWAWLIGPFAVAHQKVYGDPEKARSFLRPFSDQLATHRTRHGAVSPQRRASLEFSLPGLRADASLAASSIASTILVSSANPCHAMSKAVPWPTDVRTIGSPGVTVTLRSKP